MDIRLIDANALEQELFDADWMLDNDEHMVEDILRKQPTIDAVPVVRCKDCKHHDVLGWCTELERGTVGEAFCAYGEVKEHDIRK